MAFKSDRQRKAVMAKLKAGSTLVYSYERKRNDISGNPRHFIYNVSVVEGGKVRRIIPEIDVGYRNKDQAIAEELERMGKIKKAKDTSERITIRRRYNFVEI
jgi:hypothetical protein